MSLVSEAISDSEPERKFTEILDEFLRSYFCGTPVSIAGQTVTLPVCDLLFNQQADNRNPDGTGTLKPVIHCHLADLKPSEHGESDAIKLILTDTTLTFWVRASKPGAGRLTTDQISREIADALRALFMTERIVLAQKGIKHSRVVRGPTPLATPGVATRLLIVKATLHYRTAT